MRRDAGEQVKPLGMASSFTVHVCPVCGLVEGPLGHDVPVEVGECAGIQATDTAHYPEQMQPLEVVPLPGGFDAAVERAAGWLGGDTGWAGSVLEAALTATTSTGETDG